jgi:hypothetical protein
VEEDVRIDCLHGAAQRQNVLLGAILVVDRHDGNDSNLTISDSMQKKERKKERKKETKMN